MSFGSRDIDILFKVLEIRLLNGYDIPTDFNQLKITFRKSALFRRMMEGKEPLPLPPPRSYSYPWYSLIEDGYGYPGEVWKPTSWDKCFTDYPSIVIDQTPWKLLEELGEDDWIVTYQYGRNDKTKFADTKWHVYCIGCVYPPISQNDSYNYLWKIERVD